MHEKERGAAGPAASNALAGRAAQRAAPHSSSQRHGFPVLLLDSTEQLKRLKAFKNLKANKGKEFPETLLPRPKGYKKPGPKSGKRKAKIAKVSKVSNTLGKDFDRRVRAIVADELKKLLKNL